MSLPVGVTRNRMRLRFSSISEAPLSEVPTSKMKTAKRCSGVVYHACLVVSCSGFDPQLIVVDVLLPSLAHEFVIVLLVG